jgi:hypothetical protein
MNSCGKTSWRTLLLGRVRWTRRCSRIGTFSVTLSALWRREGEIVSNENHRGAESVGNPGQTVDSEEELNQPTAVGNPGQTHESEEELNQPTAVGNLGTSVHPDEELDQPTAVGNPGSGS